MKREDIEHLLDADCYIQLKSGSVYRAKVMKISDTSIVILDKYGMSNVVDLDAVGLIGPYGHKSQNKRLCT